MGAGFPGSGRMSWLSGQMSGIGDDMGIIILDPNTMKSNDMAS